MRDHLPRSHVLRYELPVQLLTVNSLLLETTLSFMEHADAFYLTLCFFPSSLRLIASMASTAALQMEILSC